MNAADVQLFSQIAQSGSFSEAAERLGITRSAASKAVTRLEKSLGVVLLRRSTRKLSLTDAGRRFLQYATEVDRALQDAEAAVAGFDQDIVGNLAVSLSTSLGAALLPRILRKSRRDWPQLSLSLHFDDRYVDLIGGNYDLAVRVATRLNDSSLMSRSLGTTREILVASPGYLQQHGTPRHVKDLKDHRCIDDGDSTRTQRVWRFRDGQKDIEVPVACSLTTNADLPLILAACMDEGIMKMPELLIGGEIASGRLVEILPEFADPRGWGIFALYANRKPSAKVKAFIDFIVEELPALYTVDRWTPFDQDGIESEAQPDRVA